MLERKQGHLVFIASPLAVLGGCPASQPSLVLAALHQDQGTRPRHGVCAVSEGLPRNPLVPEVLRKQACQRAVELFLCKQRLGVMLDPVLVRPYPLPGMGVVQALLGTTATAAPSGRCGEWQTACGTR